LRAASGPPQAHTVVEQPNLTALETLRAVPLFSQLRESDLSLLSGLLQQRSYSKNRVILFGHDPCEAFYIVLTGQVKVMLIAEDGREVVLSLLGPGDFFGEMALMDEEPYESSVIATEDSTLVILERETFRRCLREMTGVSLGLLRALTTRLREADHRIGELMLLDVTGRVAHLFLELATRNGGAVIPDPPTHQMIAQMIGSTRETVSRTITSLATQRLITSSTREIRIVDRPAMETAAGNLLRRRLKSPTPPRDRRSLEAHPTHG
jgi:CRP/FNR family cyclic AMP-dependent transcriptional regulator